VSTCRCAAQRGDDLIIEVLRAQIGNRYDAPRAEELRRAHNKTS
jgi:hypothetical protein